MPPKKITTTSEPLESSHLDQLRRIFPQFVKDGEVDFDALKAFFEKESVLAGAEKYGLSWAGKSDAFRAIRTPATGTLMPQPKESKNWDTTQNLFLEGDNLEVLKLLQKHYREKIKMIYIDPPYNTGKDFIYKDNFKQNIADYYERTGQSKGGIKMTSNPESSGRYHSDWLTMMYPRLFLARNLLKDDGVIFVSIDDNEVHNLRMIMDEIFGEENFVSQITVLNNPKGRFLDKYFSTCHEYLLIYSKNGLPPNSFNIEADESEILSSYTETDSSGDRYRLLELRNTHREFGKHNRPNLYYPLFIDQKSGKIFTKPGNETRIKVLPKWDDGFEGCWSWSRKKAEDDNAYLVGKKTNGKWKVFRKAFADGAEKKIKTIWSEREFHTEVGQTEFNNLFNTKEKIFQSPKPVGYMQQILKTSTSGDDIILDFFSGSGTTAQAVMGLNAEDGGNRKWICVQLPEATDDRSEAYKAGYKTIAEIAQERIRRAGAKIPKDKNVDAGFKSLSLQHSNYRQWNILTDQDDEQTLKKQAELFTRMPLVDNYDEEAVVYEVLLKEGFNLNASIKQGKSGSLAAWTVTEGDRKMVVTFTKKVTAEQVKALKLTEKDTFVCLDSALDDSTKVNISRNMVVNVI